ncbi:MULTISPECIES: hypothetical protein [Microcoleaceae]|uniref:hypothetical protein n=1 Tax=Microcoleaceae TaxID=1892252 RepID=UPI001D144A31|nr:hypothetical protein [Tychonema sp. LEGE 06208]
MVAPTADGVSTGALPLQIHHTFIQQRQQNINSRKRQQAGEIKLRSPKPDTKQGMRNLAQR